MAGAGLALMDMRRRVQLVRFGAVRTLGASSGRTQALAANNLPRAIHRLDSANSVVSCAVFFISPR